MAVVDRVRRALGELSDAMTAALQTTAEDVGGQLNEVDDWQVALFSEEVSDPPRLSLSLYLCWCPSLCWRWLLGWGW